MKMSMRFFAWVTMVAIIACSHKEDQTQTTAVDLDGGSFSMTKREGEGHELAIKTKEGTTTLQIGGGEGLAKDLNVPTYPGATEMIQGGVRLDQAEAGTVAMQWYTRDDFEKVSEFYKKALADRSPQDMTLNMPTGHVLSFMIKNASGDRTTVSIIENKKQNMTMIQVAMVKKD